MPELPEVETSRRGIAPHVVGQTIHYTVVRQSKLRWPVSLPILNLKEVLIKTLQRRGKYLLLELSYGWIVIHFGMSGHVRILPADTPAQKHDHIDIILSNGRLLRYTDPRRFGCWLWYSHRDEITVFAQLGPEPLDNAFSASYLFALSRQKKMSIKPWLMNNKVVVGIGNIYASEALFRAGIAPQRAVGSLTLSEIEKLVAAIKAVLHQAIEQGGTTLKDFLTCDGKPGYFAQQLQVYGRGGETCFRCGATIESEVMAQRNTFFCAHCQR